MHNKKQNILRGDIVTIAMQGDYGKPRPALVVQCNELNDEHTSITVLPFTSDLQDAPLIRHTIEPSESGLKKQAK